MPSPFPGMDPYLESPDIWPDFHDALAGEIRAVLNQTLPPPYYARLEMRPEVGIVADDAGTRRIVPDVAVMRQPRSSAEGAIAVLDKPRSAISNHFEVEVFSEPVRHAFVEIRDPSRGHHLITLLEIVSPANKQLGPDRDLYLRKQREVLDSDASLVELDLLRAGKRLLAYPELESALAARRPRPDYIALVSRSWQRAEVKAVSIFPALLTEPLPCVPIPLRQGEDDVPLDLQYVFGRAYDGGPYQRGAVDYTIEARPPIPAELASWAAECLRVALRKLLS